ncbi:hypothetical protein PtA15_10A560 [Puccinia triticina]|uniref:Uncharacterized protein n=1 Tax=Puccinia triticina TaxID=208348 RepID=A0ABY7CV19_9BASI|nr:uncharacterized protein PtA15_10A560 [Puccinia triticina]WAQ89136.1 hypothetical protein PtA15_10A560 [Puccinia triticina]
MGAVEVKRVQFAAKASPWPPSSDLTNPSEPAKGILTVKDTSKLEIVPRQIEVAENFFSELNIAGQFSTDVHECRLAGPLSRNLFRCGKL